jgi:hypothetical protein
MSEDIWHMYTSLMEAYEAQRVCIRELEVQAAKDAAVMEAARNVNVRHLDRDAHHERYVCPICKCWWTTGTDEYHEDNCPMIALDDVLAAREAEES